MPIVNGAYDAPTWNNNAPPAIDASELQDMCDTIETYNTQKADVDYVNTFVRPNLLDNWYFVGGGSQQGGGQFPINQRGSTSYTTGGQYTIDRWRFTSGPSISLTVNSDSISISGPTYLVQDIEGSLPPGTYTFSVNVKSYSGTCGIRIRDGSTDLVSDAISSNGVCSCTVAAGSGITTPRVIVTIATSASITLKAAKFELGDTQTLAHYDSANSVWVLNEVPNFEQELARCQRYFYAWNTDAVQYAAIATGYTTSATEARIVLPLPVKMRVKPTLTSEGSFSVGIGSNVYGATSIALESTWSNSDMVRLNAISSSMTSGSSCIVRANSTSARLYFSADL